MINFELHLSWHTYYNLVILLTLWNLGVTAITRKGKLLYPILAFFTQKKKVKTPLKERGNNLVDEELANYLCENFSKSKKTWPELFESGKQQGEVVGVAEEFFKKSDSHSDHSIIIIVQNIISHKANTYYTYLDRNRFPDLLIDPIVVCITCMASFHGIIVYTLHCIYLKHAYNPVEQIGISVPVAFTGQFLWYLNLVIEKMKNKS